MKIEKMNKQLYTALSSELLTPVLIIQQNIQILKKHCNHPDSALADESFSFVENSIENILGFIENFHFLNTAAQKKMNLNPQWFSFQDLILQVIEELRCLNLDTSRLKVTALPHQHKVILDKYLINRILINLLSNALKFSGKKVELNISILKNMLTIQVRDYGIGIPNGQITEIFNPFIRGENASRISGTGIGLSIVASAVEMMDGTVTVQSEPQKATEFQVVIPYHHIRRINHRSSKNNINSI